MCVCVCMRASYEHGVAEGGQAPLAVGEQGVRGFSVIRNCHVTDKASLPILGVDSRSLQLKRGKDQAEEAPDTS